MFTLAWLYTNLKNVHIGMVMHQLQTVHIIMVIHQPQ